MITNNISTLKIHKMTQAQYERELAAGNIDENALYLTPDEDRDLSLYLMKDEAKKEYESQSEAKEKLDEAKEYAETVILAVTKEMGEGKADKEHSHDEMYYTENEVDALIAGIPNDILWVTVTQNGDGTYSADKTCADIIEARNSGKLPVAQYGNLVYTFESSGEGALDTDCQFKRTLVTPKQISSDMLIITGRGYVSLGKRTFDMNQIANVLNVTELATTNKTITGAINELDAEVDALIESASNSEVFVITVTKGEDGKYSADKTYDEIYNAYINNKELSVRYNDGEYDGIYPLNAYDGDALFPGFAFEYHSVNGTRVFRRKFIITATGVAFNEVEFSQNRIATVNTNSTLTTTDKTLVGAINEINEKVNQESEAIPAPATATVGQTIAVKAVDENGKPTEWEAVDMVSGGGAIGGGSVKTMELLASDTLTEDVQAIHLTLPKGITKGKVIISGVVDALTKFHICAYNANSVNWLGNTIGRMVYNCTGAATTYFLTFEFEKIVGNVWKCKAYAQVNVAGTGYNSQFTDNSRYGYFITLNDDTVTQLYINFADATFVTTGDYTENQQRKQFLVGTKYEVYGV